MLPGTLRAAALCALLVVSLGGPTGVFLESAAAQSMDEFFDDSEEGIIEDGEDGGAEEDGEGDADGEDEAEADDEGEGEGETEDAEEAEEAEESAADGVDLEGLTTSPVKFSGKVNADAGLSLGVPEWPGSDAAGGESTGELLRGSGLYDMSSVLTVDARPEPHLRFRGSLETELDENTMDFTGPSVSELFVDYTLGANLFFRAGKQGLTWGQGRLLDNPANLVDRVSDGVALRGVAPLGAGSVTGVVYSIKKWVADYRSGSPRAFAYAGLYETTVGPFTAELSSHYKEDEPVGSAASLSFGLGPVDLTFEGMGNWDAGDPQAGVESYGTLAQAFWESSFADITVLGEWEYDSAVENGEGHYAAVGLQLPRFGGGWRPRVRWRHAFEDDSGEVIPAVSGAVAPSLRASVAVPVIYGQPGTYYREALEEGDDDDELPGDDVVSLLLGLSLSFSF